MDKPGHMAAGIPTEVRAAFERIDTDCSGDIDLDELITFVWGKEYTSAGAKVHTSI